MSLNDYCNNLLQFQSDANKILGITEDHEQAKGEIGETYSVILGKDESNDGLYVLMRKYGEYSTSEQVPMLIWANLSWEEAYKKHRLFRKFIIKANIYR